MKVAGSETGGYERMGTMDYTSSLLSCKLHEDKTTIVVKEKWEIDMKTVFSVCV